jgi:hypothetical protein
MNKIPVYSLDYYNKTVIKSIMEKYGLDEMKTLRLFLTPETHKVPEVRLPTSTVQPLSIRFSPQNMTYWRL